METTTTQSILLNTAEALLLVVPNGTEYEHDHDHDHDHDHELGTEVPTTAIPISPTADLIVAKVVAMVVLGLVSFTLGVLPVKLAKWLRWPLGGEQAKGGPHQLVISLLLCFGGGVLLYTTFLHLQPEVRESFQALQNSGDIPDLKHGIHIAELVFCAGFFFVYLVEELVHAVLDRRPVERADEAVLHRTMSLRRCSRHPQHTGAPDAGGEAGAGTLIPRVSLGTPPPPGSTPSAIAVSGKKTAPADDAATNGSTGSSISASTHGLLNNSSSLSAITILDAKPSPLDAELRMTGGPLGSVGVSGNGLGAGERRERGGRDHRHHHGHSHAHGHSHSHAVPFHDDEDDASTDSSTVAKSFRGLLAVLALSFHAVFEGLAVGLETSVSNVWYLFAAIATHKLVIAFCVGVELVGSRTRLALLLVYVATFAAVTPLGIGVGIALSGATGGDANTQGVVTVVLQGMAAGTLLYVVFFEVLQRERANTQAGIWQLTAIVAGFAVMFALQIATGHEHNHGGGGSSGHSHNHNHDHIGVELLMDSHAGHTHGEHAGHVH